MGLKLTIYAVFVGITFITAFYFGIYNIFKSRAKRHLHSFTTLSFIVFLLSLSNLVLFISLDILVIRISSYILTAAIYIFPAALFNYVTDIVDHNLLRIDILKYLFYIPSSAIVIFLSFSGNIKLERVTYGYTVSSGISMQLGLFYMAPLLFLIIASLAYDLKKTLNTNYPASRTMVLLCAVSVFTVTTVIMRHIEAVFSFGIPVNSFVLFLLFIVIALSNFLAELSTESLTFEKMFETTDDCILITDKNGRIIDINRKMHDTLFPEREYRKSKKANLVSSEIKKRMRIAAVSKKRLAELFDHFSKDTLERINIDIGCSMCGKVKTYNVIASPIIYGTGKVLGKIAIFRDVSETRRLQERLHQESIRDFLTGAYNRRYFYELLNNSISRFERYGEPFCLIMIDIDNFKRLNDTFGHLKGDWILQELVKIIKNSIRKGLDNVIRYGGDEFAVVLSDSDITRAEKVSKRIIDGFAGIDRDSTSLSIGISQYLKGMVSDDLIKEADSCMYEAKLEKSDFIKTAEIK